MPKTKQRKKEIIKNFARHEKDSGSPEVQIALLTEEILNLNKHLKKNPHDYTAKRGLIMKVVQRRKIIKYLSKKSVETYKNVKKELKL